MSLALYLTLTIQAAVILVVALLAAVALRRASASLRHAILAAGFCLLLVLPLLPFLPDDMALTIAPPMRLPAPSPPPVQRTREVVTAGSVSPVDWRTILFLLHGFGSTVLIGRIVLSRYRLHLEIEASHIAVPLVYGLLQQRIYLPPDAASWSDERREAVLTHERQHLERRDTWWQLFSQVGVAIFWPNPLVWLARRRMEEECEQACDDGVLASGVAPSDYATHLLDIARSLVSNNASRSTTASSTTVNLEGGLAMARNNSLHPRLRALLNPLHSHSLITRSTVGTVTLLAILLLLPVAGVRFIALAQSPGLAGVVRDISGAAVDGARVTASSNNRKEIVLTNAEGEYSFAALPTGNWMVSVAKPGFARLDVNGLAVTEGAAQRFDPVLHVGQITETIRVTPPDATTDPPRAIRVGGNVQSAKVVTRVRPEYPPDCRAEGIQGIVLLKAVIAKDGAVMSLTPVNKLVDERLQRAATTAVSQWRYGPTLLNGAPIEVITEVEISFTLMK